MHTGVVSDILGDVARVSIDRSLYSDAAIFKAAYWFTDFHYLYLKVEKPGTVTLELRPKSPATADELNRACAEFCNSLVDFRVRQIVLQETKSVREALVLKAFQEGIPAPGLPGAVSNEIHLTREK